ncbi:MAG: hypothetical protein E7547_02785 [Ruminococcaceae bacterium]|nr:hypothetical protein [Oscillospiraceae bacterium]
MIYEQIRSYAKFGEELPRNATAADRMAYHSLMPIIDCYRKRILNAEQTKAEECKVRALYNELSNTEGRLRAMYTSQQEFLRKAEMELTAIVKDVKPGADFVDLFKRAMQIISYFEGQPHSVELKNIEKKLKKVEEHQ